MIRYIRMSDKLMQRTQNDKKSINICDIFALWQRDSHSRGAGHICARRRIIISRKVIAVR